MPGSISDSYDIEWGTAAKGDEIREQLAAVHRIVSAVLGHLPPIYIGDLVRDGDGAAVSGTLSEKQWRIVRFALERAGESI